MAGPSGRCRLILPLRQIRPVRVQQLQRSVSITAISNLSPRSKTQRVTYADGGRHTFCRTGGKLSPFKVSRVSVMMSGASDVATEQ